MGRCDTLGETHARGETPPRPRETCGETTDVCVRGETHALPFVERRAHSWGDAHTRGDAHSRWRDVHTRGEKCAALIRIVIRTELIYIIDVDGKKCVFTVEHGRAGF